MTDLEKAALTQLVIARNDAEMALAGTWDRSDDGFQCQIESIDKVLAMAPADVVNQIVAENPVPDLDQDDDEDEE